MTNDIAIEAATESTTDNADGNPADHGNYEQAIIAALAADLSVIRCGCGFLAISSDQGENRYALEEHSCQRGPTRPVAQQAPTPWYGYVFSFYGAAILAIIAYAVLIGLGAVRG